MPDDPVRELDPRRLHGGLPWVRRPSSFHNMPSATLVCKSPIEMSPASPIEASLGQSAIGTFGVAYDDGDPDERSGAEPAAGDGRLSLPPGYGGSDKEPTHSR